MFSPPLNPSPKPLEWGAEMRILPASFETAVTSIDSESGRLTFQGQFYKNRLQEFTQKSGIALPVYETVNIGQVHAPEFRSTVLVDGLNFTSSNTFFNRKAAEQQVAKIALETISRKVEDEGISLIQEDTIFCKSILHEYAVKISHDQPIYTTHQSEGILRVFSSSTIFNGQTYMGHPAKSKKEAEQMAARAVIESILGHSDKRALMCTIIRSKRKLYAALSADGSSSSLSSGDVLARSQNNPIDAVNGKKVSKNLRNTKLLESMSVGNEQNAKAIASGTLTPEAKILKEGYASELSFGDEGNTSAGNEQNAKAIATETLTPEAKILKEGYTSELSFGDEGNSHSQQTFPQGNSLASMASNASNSFDGSLSHDRIDNEATTIGPYAEGSPRVVLTSGMKRSDAMRNEESDSKKSRTAE